MKPLKINVRMITMNFKPDVLKQKNVNRKTKIQPRRKKENKTLISLVSVTV